MSIVLQGYGRGNIVRQGYGRNGPPTRVVIGTVLIRPAIIGRVKVQAQR